MVLSDYICIYLIRFSMVISLRSAFFTICQIISVDLSLSFQKYDHMGKYRGRSGRKVWKGLMPNIIANCLIQGPLLRNVFIRGCSITPSRRNRNPNKLTRSDPLQSRYARPQPPPTPSPPNHSALGSIGEISML